MMKPIAHNNLTVSTKLGTVLLGLAVVLMLTGCQQNKPKPPPKPDVYSYSSGRGPLSVNADILKFSWAFVALKNGKPDVGSYYIQELEITEIVQRKGTTVFRAAAIRKEGAVTNKKGEWWDDHEQRADELVTFDGDYYLYKVTATVYRVSGLKVPGGGKPIDGVFYQKVTVKKGTGPEQTQIKPNLSYTYSKKFEVAKYEYSWEIARDLIAKTREGKFTLTFTKPGKSSETFEGSDPDTKWKKK